ncbi:MAG: cell wall hydrolase [Defluviitaleaceae bacterium]|nr:cell wall hydrolase [Defluviitaleaceae bacterium]
MKKIFCMSLFFAILFGTNTVHAQNINHPELRIVIDGEVLGSQISVLNNSIYVSAREIAPYVGKSIDWCEIDGLIMQRNGVNLNMGFHLQNSRAMVSLNDMLRNVPASVEFHPNFNVISINIAKSIEDDDLFEILPNFSSYTREDLEWLARIIFAEARGEDYNGMLAVGNVVLNRTVSHLFPDTIREVIFDRQNGVQFTPTLNGSINNNPCQASWMAAFEVLEGRSNVGASLFFKNPAIASNTWISRNRQFAMSIGNHSFYY